MIIDQSIISYPWVCIYIKGWKAVQHNETWALKEKGEAEQRKLLEFFLCFASPFSLSTHISLRCTSLLCSALLYNLQHKHTLKSVFNSSRACIIFTDKQMLENSYISVSKSKSAFTTKPHLSSKNGVTTSSVLIFYYTK